MKNGIPCNEYRHIVKAKKNRIVFRFVSEDGRVASSCTVGIGDTDPLTGSVVSDPSVFLEYYRLADHQVYIQNKEVKGLLYLDGIMDDEGDGKAEKKKEFAVPAYDPFDEESDEVEQLREFASSLSGRLADVYEAMLVKYAGGKEKISMTDLARKWGVSVTQISYDRKKIIRMIKERMSEPAL